MSSDYSPSHQDEKSRHSKEEEEEEKDKNKMVRDKERQVLNYFKNIVHPTILLSECNEMTDPEYVVTFGLNYMHRVDFIDFVIKFGLNFDNVDAIYQMLM